METKQELNPEEFTLLLRKFNKLTEKMPPVIDVENELIRMRVAASDDGFLNHRQKDAIIARCTNYIDGNYGGSTRQHTVGKPKPSSNGKEQP